MPVIPTDGLKIFEDPNSPRSLFVKLLGKVWPFKPCVYRMVEILEPKQDEVLYTPARFKFKIHELALANTMFWDQPGQESSFDVRFPDFDKQPGETYEGYIQRPLGKGKQSVTLGCQRDSTKPFQLCLGGVEFEFMDTVSFTPAHLVLTMDGPEQVYTEEFRTFTVTTLSPHSEEIRIYPSSQEWHFGNNQNIVIPAGDTFTKFQAQSIKPGSFNIKIQAIGFGPTELEGQATQRHLYFSVNSNEFITYGLNKTIPGPQQPKLFINVAEGPGANRQYPIPVDLTVTVFPSESESTGGASGSSNCSDFTVPTKQVQIPPGTTSVVVFDPGQTSISGMCIQTFKIDAETQLDRYPGDSIGGGINSIA